jgi:hypothetical protein
VRVSSSNTPKRTCAAPTPWLLPEEVYRKSLASVIRKHCRGVTATARLVGGSGGAKPKGSEIGLMKILDQHNIGAALIDIHENQAPPVPRQTQGGTPPVDHPIERG